MVIALRALISGWAGSGDGVLLAPTATDRLSASVAERSGHTVSRRRPRRHSVVALHKGRERPSTLLLSSVRDDDSDDGVGPRERQRLDSIVAIMMVYQFVVVRYHAMAIIPAVIARACTG